MRRRNFAFCRSVALVVRAPRRPVDADLAPGPADHVLAHRTVELTEQRLLDPARVGSGQIKRIALNLRQIACNLGQASRSECCALCQVRFT
jgi:hypothetical protein